MFFSKALFSFNRNLIRKFYQRRQKEDLFYSIINSYCKCFGVQRERLSPFVRVTFRFWLYLTEKLQLFCVSFFLLLNSKCSQSKCRKRNFGLHGCIEQNDYEMIILTYYFDGLVKVLSNIWKKRNRDYSI